MVRALTVRGGIFLKIRRISRHPMHRDHARASPVASAAAFLAHEYTSAFSRHAAPEVCKFISPKNEGAVRSQEGRRRPSREGRREDRVRAAPAVSCAKVANKNAHEHTGSAETLRPSLRNGFTAYLRALPGETIACLSPSFPRSVSSLRT